MDRTRRTRRTDAAGQAGLDRRVREEPRALLAGPADNHAFEHGRRLVEMDDTVDERQMSNPGDLFQSDLSCQLGFDIVNLNVTQREEACSGPSPAGLWLGLVPQHRA